MENLQVSKKKQKKIFLNNELILYFKVFSKQRWGEDKLTLILHYIYLSLYGIWNRYD